MKIHKFNLFAIITTLVSSNIFGVQCVQATEIEPSVNSGLLFDSQSSFADQTSLKIDQESSIGLAQTDTNPQQKVNIPQPARLTNAKAYNDRGSKRAAAGDHQGAIADFTEAIRRQPKYAEAYSNRGDVRATLGDKQGALADFSQAIQLNPKDGEAYNSRGSIRIELGDKQGALADFSQAIQLNPKFTDAYNNRGNARVTLGDRQGALADFSQAIQLNPKFTDAYNNRGNARATLGDKQGALADFSQAIQLNPKDGEAYNSRGSIRIELGDKQGALADFSQAIQLNPKDGESYKNRGNLQWDLGDKQAAIADFSQAILLNPKDGESYNNRGNIRADLKDKQGALADFSQAIQLNPNSAESYKSRGNLRWDLKDKQGALADFNQAIQLNPKPNAEDYQSRGNLQWDLGDKQAAIADFNQALLLNPKDGSIYTSRGNIRAELGDKQGAIADFNQALALNPKDGSIYNSRGNIRAELGDKQGAIADFNQALLLNPQDGSIYNSRGNIRAELGDKQGAIADFNQALLLNPKDAEAYNYRGGVRAELDDRQGAISDYNQALLLKPNYTEAYNNRRDLLFSTTPQFQGELVFGAGSVSGSNSTRNLISLSQESLSLLASVSITTSFTGHDRFLARFQASAFGAPTSTDPSGYTPEGRLAWTDGTNNSQTGLQALTYQFPVSPSTEVSLAVVGGDSIENIAGSNINPYFGGGGSTGAISYFGSAPSFYYHMYGTGFGIQQKLGRQFELGAGYLGQTGLFAGESAVLARLLYKPTDQSKIALTYVNADRTQTGTGSRNVNNVYLQGTNQALGLEGYYQVSSSLGLGGWIGHTTSTVADGNATSLSWAMSAAIPNLGGDGNVAGLLVGQEPSVTSASGSLSSFADPSRSLHLELFYQYKINNNLSITPGLIYVTAPDSNGQNSGALIGAVRANVSINF